MVRFLAKECEGVVDVCSKDAVARISGSESMDTSRKNKTIPVPHGILTDQPSSILEGWTQHYDQAFSERLDINGSQLRPSGSSSVMCCSHSKP